MFKLRHTLSWIRSIFFFDLLIYAYTVVLALASLVTSLFEKRGCWQHRIARLWSWLILRTSCCKLEVEGLDKLDTSKPYLYAANHISAFDIPTLYATLPVQFRIMAKEELFRYPFLGWHLHRSGQLPINQGSTASALRSLKRAVETLRGGMPLVIFPEGGRSDDGTIKPFQSGAFFVAIKAGVEIVPVTLIGTYEVLKMNTYHIHPGPIRVVFGEPISVSGATLHDMGAISAKTQQVIEDTYYANATVADPRSACTAQI